METRSSRSDRPSTLKPGDVPFLGWSRVAHEFRIKAAVMAPQGFRPLIIGDPGVGKRTMAKSWLPDLQAGVRRSGPSSTSTLGGRSCRTAVSQ